MKIPEYCLNQNLYYVLKKNYDLKREKILFEIWKKLLKY